MNCSMHRVTGVSVRVDEIESGMYAIIKFLDEGDGEVTLFTKFGVPEIEMFADRLAAVADELNRIVEEETQWLRR